MPKSKRLLQMAGPPRWGKIFPDARAKGFLTVPPENQPIQTPRKAGFLGCWGPDALRGLGAEEAPI